MMEKEQRMLTAMVVDDDMDSVDYLAELIEVTDGLELVASANNPREGLSLLKTLAVDVLFLDMEMPVVNGMQFMAQLQLIREINPAVANMQVVVCSAHEHFAVKSYDYKVTDYLVKPVFFDRYIEAIKEVKKRVRAIDLTFLSPEDKCFFVHVERSKKVYRLPFSEIIYLEAYEQRTRLWVSDEKYYEVYMVLKNILLLLPQYQFIKVHRSYAISVAHFAEKNGKEIILKNLREKIPVGKYGNYPLFEDWLGENALIGRVGIVPAQKDNDND